MDYAEIKVGTTIYVKVKTAPVIEYTGTVEARQGNMVYLHRQRVGGANLAIDLDTASEFYVIPEEPESVWLTASGEKETVTINTAHGSLVLTFAQFEALKGLV